MKNAQKKTECRHEEYEEHGLDGGCLGKTYLWWHHLSWEPKDASDEAERQLQFPSQHFFLCYSEQVTYSLWTSVSFVKRKWWGLPELYAVYINHPTQCLACKRHPILLSDQAGACIMLSSKAAWSNPSNPKTTKVLGLILALWHVNGASQECCLFYLSSLLRSSDLLLFYFWGLLPSLSFSHRHSGLLFPVLTT